MSHAYITHQPLVNRQSKIIATRLSLHLGAAGSMKVAVATLDALAEAWPQQQKPAFIDCAGSPGSSPVDPGLLDWIVPDNATLELPSAALLGARGGDFVGALLARRPALCLKFDQGAAQAVGTGVPFRFIAFDAKIYTPEQLRVLAAKTRPYGIGLAFNVGTAEDFRACLDAGMNAAASWFFKAPAGAPAKTLNPGQAQIVRVINLVRRNADAKEIEAALKQDVALSYKLLRYINSAGFGLSCEIQSFRHAVSILGYEKLNKWLSLLLATASKDPMAPALMHTALARARLMELLGQGLVDKQEHDNLFITGAFSLLDTLLGVSMDKALEAMHLPEAIGDALLGNGGLYAPFLDLALACEGSDGQAVAGQAGLLGISADHFNSAQLEALAFADAMEL
ncbi:MAG: HDOD domain-containing protein [Betaproteobacteria bacterium]|nr:HDOD domain-containing protein [Betaproteobacteria bacterium]